MSFTFTNNGTPPIAVITMNKKRKYVYLSSPSDVESSDEEEETKGGSILNEKLDPKTIGYMTDQLKKGLTLEEMYKTLRGSSSGGGLSKERKTFKSYSAKEGEEVEVMPNPYPERVLVCGTSGLGKTRVVAKYGKRYLKIHPDNTINAFVRQAGDPELKDLPKQGIVLDYEHEDEDGEPDEENLELLHKLVDNKIPLKELSNSLCVYDDCDNIQDRKLLTAVHKLMDDCGANGRKAGIHCLYISHIIFNYKLTRSMLNEANKTFIFPEGAEDCQVENYLTRRCMMKKKKADQFLKDMVKSRWFMVQKGRPKYIIHEKGMFFL